MMSQLQIVVLSLIQGITEYLPISSSGHSILVPAFTGWPDQGVLTDAITNLGTVTATILYFWRDVLRMIEGLFDFIRRRASSSANLFKQVVVGSVPIIVIGLVYDHYKLDETFRMPLLIAINSILFGIVLYVADLYGHSVKRTGDLNIRDSFIIGLFQCLALNPGTSRSGITMTGGRFLGYNRGDAAKLAFLIGIAANLGGSVKKLANAVVHHDAIGLDQIEAGVLTFFIGLGTVAFLMRYIRTHDFLPFVVYRVVLGAAILGLIYSGALSAWHV
jgi:undecaprenyl-diphosphatase